MLGKVVLVTGGANGIGKAIVLHAAKLGAYPVIVDKDEIAGKQLSKLLDEQKCRNLFIGADLMDIKQCSRVATTVMETFGRIDVLVNNAGGNDSVGLDARPGEFVESLYRNLVPTFSITHYVVPFMKKSRSYGCDTNCGCVDKKADNNCFSNPVGPAIINILSKVFTTGQGGTSGYAASKGGLASLTREWALDLLPFGIRVNAVVPAEVMTTGYDKWLALFPEEERKAKLGRITGSIPLGRRMTTPEEIAKTVLFLASGDASHTTGQFLFVDGGYTHLDRLATATSKL